MINTYLLTPFQKFVKIESLSGVLLFAATLIAMIWANSDYGAYYQSLWAFQIGLDADTFGLTKPLILWINDGLMAIFFFLIGLEIKRELIDGELNSLRKATFPLFAAAGGMVIPLAIFMFLNTNPLTSSGWGIPMATDIAFSLAILNLLGKSVPLSLKIFLTAFAIIDDIGAVLVIAVFYSGGISWTLLLVALILLIGLFVLSYKGMYNKYMTLVLGLIVWLLFLKSGIHPTIAGVLLAFTIPIRSKLGAIDFRDKVSTIADRIVKAGDSSQKVQAKKEMAQIDNLQASIKDFNSPLQNLEHKLHGWVAYFIMPVFALANAGIVFSSDMNLDLPLIINISVGLFMGKFLGVTLFSFLAVKLRVAELPQDVNYLQIMGVAILAGVGFTMSIFIANLAFVGNEVFMDSAKVGILAGSLISGFIGAMFLKYSGSKSSAVSV